MKQLTEWKGEFKTKKIMKTFDVFTRKWWRENKDYPDGLQPHLGRKHYVLRGVSETVALEYCARYKRENDGGRYSVKAEYTASK